MCLCLAVTYWRVLVLISLARMGFDSPYDASYLILHWMYSKCSILGITTSATTSRLLLSWTAAFLLRYIVSLLPATKIELTYHRTATTTGLPASTRFVWWFFGDSFLLVYRLANLVVVGRCVEGWIAVVVLEFISFRRDEFCAPLADVIWSPSWKKVRSQ